MFKMNAVLGLLSLTMSANAFAAKVVLRSATADYSIEAVSNDWPKAMQDQTVKSNAKARENALQNAVNQLEDACIDPHWGSRYQMDIVSLKDDSVTSTAKSIDFKLTVTAVCRQSN